MGKALRNQDKVLKAGDRVEIRLLNRQGTVMTDGSVLLDGDPPHHPSFIHESLLAKVER